MIPSSYTLYNKCTKTKNKIPFQKKLFSVSETLCCPGKENANSVAAFAPIKLPGLIPMISVEGRVNQRISIKSPFLK